MTQRTYRTAQGKTVDLGALQLKNENVRAVGNLPVNARGDLLDSYNRPIDSRNQQVSKQYQKQVTNVNNDTVVSSKKQLNIQPVSQIEPEVTPVDSVNETTSNTGLAAAIARARQIKQEPEKTKAQLTRQTSGIKKI